MLDNNSLIYFNTAACGLISPDVLQTGIDLYKKFSINSATTSEDWREEELMNVRNTIADFVGAKEESMALIPNFSFALNNIVQSLNGNEKVLLFSNDFPSVLAPFVANHFAISWINPKDNFFIDLEEIERTIESKKIELLAISHVQWSSGFKIDLEKLSEICHKHNVDLIVDATQSVGAQVINISQLKLQVLLASNYKWMNAGFGSGIMYMSDAFLKKYPPVVGSINNVQRENNDWKFLPSIRCYELGHLNMVELNILKNAIQEKNKIGLKNIVRHNEEIMQFLLDGLVKLPVKLVGEMNMNNRSSILILQDEKGLGEWLQQNNIVVTQRNQTLRIGLHFYNTKVQVNSFLEYVAAWAKEN
ncbi:MAG TPA: aminotransferase class V-fold PLP-dependent enzyme [Arachidicoccus soli]|nr:aminotransferase class V-fold PLP-dependent enzyme [Arachidicoccus soli]